MLRFKIFYTSRTNHPRLCSARCTLSQAQPSNLWDETSLGSGGWVKMFSLTSWSRIHQRHVWLCFFCLMLRLENLFQRLCIPQKHQQIFTAALRMLVLPAHQLLIQHGVSNAALMHAGLPVEQCDLAWANGESSTCQVSIYWKKYIKTIETKIVLIQTTVFGNKMTESCHKGIVVIQNHQFLECRGQSERSPDVESRCLARGRNSVAGIKSAWCPILKSVLMLDSEEGGVELTKISMRSYFMFLLHLYNGAVDFWTIKVKNVQSEGDADRLGQ